jgi:hypothetical protein
MGFGVRGGREIQAFIHGDDWFESYEDLLQDSPRLLIVVLIIEVRCYIFLFKVSAATNLDLKAVSYESLAKRRHCWSIAKSSE